jgi:signal peptidase I
MSLVGDDVDVGANAPTCSTSSSKTKGRSVWRRAIVWSAAPASAVAFAFLVHSFLFEAFSVPSGSMIPTLDVGDRMLVNKSPFGADVHRGDVVVFNRAPGDPNLEYPILVKRVLGLPGETISSRGATVLVNGRPLAEPWLPDLSAPMPAANHCPQAAYNIRVTHLPARSYFVMGDCRGISADSRSWGLVPASHIIGKVFFVFWRNGHPWFHWL